MTNLQRLAVAIWLVPAALAIPAPTQHPNDAVVLPRQPMVTAVAKLEERSPDIGDIAGSYVGSVLSGLGSGVSSFVASGIPMYFQDLPVGDGVKKSLGLSDSDLAAKPTQVLNIP